MNNTILIDEEQRVWVCGFFNHKIPVTVYGKSIETLTNFTLPGSNLKEFG